MPVLPIDLQTNMAQMTDVSKMANKMEHLSEQDQANAAQLVQNKAKQVDHSVTGLKQNPETEYVVEDKKDEDKSHGEKKQKKKYSLNGKEENEVVYKKRPGEPYKGKIIDILE